jgi:microcystin-dependent protein
MATVTGLTKERMEEMEAATIIDGTVIGDNLHLTTRGGTDINAGSVRGPMGPGGSGFVVCTSTTRPTAISADEGKAIYETDTDLTRIWTGTRWKLQERIICTSTTRPAGLGTADEGVQIYETDTNSEYVWTGTSWLGAGSVPLGSCIEYYGTLEPAGWKFPNGQTISRTTYAALFALLSTTYGAGDGTTFGLPDKRQRVGVMAGGALSLGAVGGESSHVLTLAELASHAHSINGVGDHAHAFSGYATLIGELPTSSLFINSGANVEHPNVDVTFSGMQGAGAHTHTEASVGSNSAHNNMQPYLVCNYLMRVV